MIMDTWQYNARKNQLEWLLTMANNPGFSDHAWHLAKLMDTAPSGLFAGIAADLEERMRKSTGELAKAGD